MRCSQAKKNLTALLDGELDEKSRARIEEHLAGCGACRSEREALERVRHALESVKMPEIESSVSADSILDRARAARRPSRAGQREDRGWRLPGIPAGLRPVAALATGLLVVAIVWGIPFFRSIPLPTDQEVFMAERMELFENLDLISDLSLLEGLEIEEGQGGELS
jgi:anti-sigma factor RsiW